MDLKSRERWEDYSRAKDEMFQYCDTEDSPWYVVPADNKKKARLNCISHLLSQLPYERIPSGNMTLPARKKGNYQRPPIEQQRFVPEVY